MFIDVKRSGYTRAGEQFAHGRFLVLCQRKGWEFRNDEIRAFVVYARMSQCGNFMMSKASKGGELIVLSGAYGSDGLPKDVSPAIYDAATPVPAELVAAWNKGGGWNGAGSEADAMRAWAIATFPASPRRR